MNKKLQQAAKEWAIKHDYKRSAMPEVKAYNLQYRKETGKYPYNSAIKEFILSKETIASELVDQLEMEIYLSQHDIDRDKKEAQKKTMLAAGWFVLDQAVMDQAIAEGKKLQVKATKSLDWLTVGVDEIYKPAVFHGGVYVLMKAKARSRGYALSGFENAFCKLI